jgi:hypothetical protein
VAGAGDGLPPALKARLFAAVDLIILWNKTDGQATVTATITDATLAALPAILDPTQDGYHDTDNPDDLGPLTQHPPSVSVAWATGTVSGRWRRRQVRRREGSAGLGGGAGHRVGRTRLVAGERRVEVW